jgi:hypothetical protein
MMVRLWFRPAYLTAISIVALSVPGVVAAQTYKAIGEYKIEGSSANGIAADTDSRRLFVATSAGVEVLNLDTGAHLGTVAGTKGTQDVLLIPITKDDETAPSTTGFAADGNGEVIAFSLDGLKPLATVKLETAGPARLCYDEAAQEVEAVSAAGSLTSLDASNGKVVKHARMQTGDGQIACGTLAHVYVADPIANVVHELNHKTMTNDGDLPMQSGKQPTGLSLDTKGRRLFVACEDGTIEIIDTDAGFTFRQLKTGTGAAHEIFVWLPQGKGEWKAADFVTSKEGMLAAVRMNAFINYTLAGQYKLTPGLGALAFDAKTKHLLLSRNDAGRSASVLVVGY